jgi:hypothetical protein
MNAASRPGSGAPRIPLTEEDEVADRISGLEQRLARMERGSRLRARGRSMLDRVVPPEATKHFRKAGRENLLGMRTLVDFWISRLDDGESRTSAPVERETIEIE